MHLGRSPQYSLPSPTAIFHPKLTPETSRLTPVGWWCLSLVFGGWSNCTIFIVSPPLQEWLAGNIVPLRGHFSSKSWHDWLPCSPGFTGGLASVSSRTLLCWHGSWSMTTWESRQFLRKRWEIVQCWPTKERVGQRKGVTEGALTKWPLVVAKCNTQWGRGREGGLTRKQWCWRCLLVKSTQWSEGSLHATMRRPHQQYRLHNTCLHSPPTPLPSKCQNSSLALPLNRARSNQDRRGSKGIEPLSLLPGFCFPYFSAPPSNSSNSPPPSTIFSLTSIPPGTC